MNPNFVKPGILDAWFDEIRIRKNSSMSSILITGANGNVGSEVAEQLTLKNVPY